MVNQFYIPIFKKGVSDYDNNFYMTVKIGTQEWIVENLRTTHYADGVAIPNLTTNVSWIADLTGAYCWYDNDIINKEIYGALYNWYAVNNAHGLAYFKKDGVQQTGWRIATDADWTTLTTFLGGLTVAGGRLKEVGVVHWTTPNTGATDIEGFAALPGGYRLSSDGSFSNVSPNGIWWTATEYNVNSSWYRSMSYNNVSVTRNNTDKNNGFSVRCVRTL